MGNEPGKLFQIAENLQAWATFCGKQLISNLYKLATKMYQSTHIHMEIGWQQRKQRKSKETQKGYILHKLNLCSYFIFAGVLTMPEGNCIEYRSRAPKTLKVPK